MRLVRYTPATTYSLSPRFALGRSPWAGLENEIEQLFASALGDIAGGAADRVPIDLYEDKDNAYVRAELPGVNRADISVEVVDDYLNISATRKAKDGEGERSFAFSRSISIPESARADQVSAAYENGVLTVTLPKKEEAKPRKIAVSVN